jgi:hypothetical protein
VIRRHSRGALALAALVALAATAPSAAEISAEDRDKVVKYLTSTRDQVIAEASGLSDAQWSFKQGPDRWSVGEVVEHLTLAESFIFELQQKTMAGEAATPEQLKGAQGRDEAVVKLIPDRTKKVTAPEPLQPVKRLGTPAEVLSMYRERRAKTLDYAAKTKDDLRSRVAPSPLGPLDAYQWLLFIGAHTERHLAQIREVKADAQFPKGGSTK